MAAIRLFGVLVLTLMFTLAAESGGGKDKKKDAKNDKKFDVVGVVTEVKRDDNPKDNVLGFIMVKTATKDDVKVNVHKSTDITQDGKKVGFKALDKDDHVSIDTAKKHPDVAEKIVIRNKK